MGFLRSTVKRGVLAIHKAGIRVGVHILPVHYYSPVPDILMLNRTRDVWAKKSDLPGMAIDLDDQAANLRRICLPYEKEYAGNRHYRDGTQNHFGPGYGYVEAQALHGFVRHYKPRRIVEVGSGVSTYCMLKASELNLDETGASCKILCIEPYPSKWLRGSAQVELMPQPVQTVGMDVFTELEASDLLFIDSSHTVKPGGDVNHLILEVLPRLQSGVVVHFHDIFFPYDYQPDVCETFLHWSETSLLRAFLTFNTRADIIACLSHLHYERRDALQEVFPEYRPRRDVAGLISGERSTQGVIEGHFPASTYIQMR